MNKIFKNKSRNKDFLCYNKISREGYDPDGYNSVR